MTDQPDGGAATEEASARQPEPESYPAAPADKMPLKDSRLWWVLSRAALLLTVGFGAHKTLESMSVSWVNERARDPDFLEQLADDLSRTQGIAAEYVFAHEFSLEAPTDTTSQVRSMELGSAHDRICFLTRVAGNFTRADNEVSVAVNGDEWVLTARQAGTQEDGARLGNYQLTASASCIVRVPPDRSGEP